MTTLRACLVVGGLVLLAAGSARADGVPPPPERCPEGSTAIPFCHGPQTCEIAGCEADGDCGAGAICEEQPLCVREHCCSGRCCGGGCDVAPTIYTHVAGRCGAGGSCEELGTTCEQRKVCVPGARADAGSPGVDAGPGPDGGSSVDAGGADAGGADAGEDAGEDAGRRMDAGRDAGGGGAIAGGGCCSVIGARSGVAGGLFLAVLGIAVARLARRRAR